MYVYYMGLNWCAQPERHRPRPRRLRAPSSPVANVHFKWRRHGVADLEEALCAYLS